jgi:hypothetical protein
MKVENQPFFESGFGFSLLKRVENADGVCSKPLFSHTDLGRGYCSNGSTSERSWELDDCPSPSKNPLDELAAVVFGCRKSSLTRGSMAASTEVLSPSPTPLTMRSEQLRIRWLLHGCDGLAAVSGYADEYCDSILMEQMLLLHSAEFYRSKRIKMLEAGKELWPRPGSIVGFLVSGERCGGALEFLSNRDGCEYDVVVHYVSQTKFDWACEIELCNVCARDTSLGMKCVAGAFAIVLSQQQS